MSKMNELNLLVQGIEEVRGSLVNIADELAEIFLRQEEEDRSSHRVGKGIYLY